MEKCEGRMNRTKRGFVKIHGGMKNLTHSESLHIFTTVHVCLEEWLNTCMTKREDLSRKALACSVNYCGFHALWNVMPFKVFKWPDSICIFWKVTLNLICRKVYIWAKKDTIWKFSLNIAIEAILMAEKRGTYHRGLVGVFQHVHWL